MDEEEILEKESATLVFMILWCETVIQNGITKFFFVFPPFPVLMSDLFIREPANIQL